MDWPSESPHHNITECDLDNLDRKKQKTKPTPQIELGVWKNIPADFFKTESKSLEKNGSCNRQRVDSLNTEKPDIIYLQRPLFNFLINVCLILFFLKAEK